MANLELANGGTSFYQYDTGMELILDGCTGVTELHFETSGGVTGGA